MLDEFEKTYDRDDQESILTLLDGVFPSKKLFILTCNDKWSVDSHMRNRPGRIYYMIDFTGLDELFIKEYCEDNLQTTQHIEAICKIANMYGEFNFDMLKALVEEMNMYNETPQQALKLLNVKPEFSTSELTYNVEIFFKNKIIPSEDLYESEFTGNPLSNSFTVRYKIHTTDDWNWNEINVDPADIVEVDKTGSKFVFVIEQYKVILTRQISRTFDIWKAL